MVNWQCRMTQKEFNLKTIQNSIMKETRNQWHQDVAKRKKWVNKGKLEIWGSD